MQKSITVAITGAGGNVGSSLCFFLSSGKVFGQNTNLRLKLIELPKFKSKLEGIKMELEVIEQQY